MLLPRLHDPRPLIPKTPHKTQGLSLRLRDVAKPRFFFYGRAHMVAIDGARTRGQVTGRRVPDGEAMPFSPGAIVSDESVLASLAPPACGADGAQRGLAPCSAPYVGGMLMKGPCMSQRSKLRHSRAQWKHKARQRGDDNRYLRKELARVKRERDHHKQARQAAEARLRQLESRQGALVAQTKGDMVWVALKLFVEARISFRAVSRVLDSLAKVLGLKRAPCPQTVINWVMRLSIVRLQAAAPLRGSSLSAVPFSNGLIWMIDISITLGAGQILAVLALDARHHQRSHEAPRLGQVHCLAVAVAASWDGEHVAAFLQRVIAVLGRPTAYLKDGGSELRKATELLDDRGLGSASIDDISHVVANILKRHYQDHPQFATFLSACGRVSGKLKQTILACLTPPRVPSKARFMNVHRLVTWADRVLKLSPVGGAAHGSMLAKLRACLDQLPACRALIKRFREDATPLLACQEIVKTRGLSHHTLAECEALIGTIPSFAVRREFDAYLRYQLETATALGLDHVGLPISSDAIESLFGVAKRQGVGELHDAGRIALRLPALCGPLTRSEAQQVLTISVSEQHEFSSGLPSLTKQRREVLAHPERLEQLGLDQGATIELIAGSKNRPNVQNVIDIPMGYEESDGPHLAYQEEPRTLARAGP